jgi:hypothetical protein
MRPPTSTVGPEHQHTFTTLKGSFKAWAADRDQDALAVLRMGDMRLDSLFELGLVGALIAGHASANVGRRYGTHEMPLLKVLVDRTNQLKFPSWKS